MKQLTYLLWQTRNCIAGFERVQEVSVLNGSRHLHSVETLEEEEDILEMVAANSTKLIDQLLVYFKRETQREARSTNDLSNLMLQLLESVNERRSFVEELERLRGNLVTYKTREKLKSLHKDDLVKFHSKPCEDVMVIISDFHNYWETRIIPGPACIVQAANLRKIADNLEGEEEYVMSTHEYIRNVIKDVGENDDFTRGLWLSTVEYANVDRWIVSGYFGDIKKFLKNRKLEKVVAIIKSYTPNALGDLIVTLKDLSGTIFGSIHYKVVMEDRFRKMITVEAALILHNVFVFFHKQLTHYLNITRKNMVNVFHKDDGLHSLYALF
ncbi:hypothetical protein Tco_0444486 [Tanacetum coccineum]